MSFAKFLRTPFLTEQFWWLLKTIENNKAAKVTKLIHYSFELWSHKLKSGSQLPKKLFLFASIKALQER